MEKDGTLASVLLLEVACYAKSQGKSLIDLLDDIYTDPQVGFYATCKTQLPKEGVFEGIDGDIHKKNIIRNLVASLTTQMTLPDRKSPIVLQDCQ